MRYHMIFPHPVCPALSHFRQSKLFKKCSELPSVLCIQTILDSPWETKTFQLLSDVLGIKTKMLKTTHKNLLGLAPISIFNVISKHTSFTICELTEHLSVPWRVMFLLIRKLLYIPSVCLNALHYFLSLVKFSISLDVSLMAHSRVNFFAKHFRELCFLF